MQPSGNLASLAERLKQKTELEREQLESIVKDELITLRGNLQHTTKNALSTIKSDMEKALKEMTGTTKSQVKILNWSLGRQWLMTALMALAVTTGVALGAWGATKLALSRAENLMAKISDLNSQKMQLETTIKEIQTWGLTLTERPEGRFIILPPKTKPRIGWTIDNRQAIKME